MVPGFCCRDVLQSSFDDWLLGGVGVSPARPCCVCVLDDEKQDSTLTNGTKESYLSYTMGLRRWSLRSCQGVTTGATPQRG